MVAHIGFVASGCESGCAVKGLPGRIVPAVAVSAGATGSFHDGKSVAATEAIDAVFPAQAQNQAGRFVDGDIG